MYQKQSEWRKELLDIEHKTDDMKRIRKITNELLINSGYHNKNLEIQMKQLEGVNASNNEIETVSRVYEYNNKKAKVLWERLNKLLTNEGF